jgi:hypothetical protein
MLKIVTLKVMDSVTTAFVQPFLEYPSLNNDVSIVIDTIHNDSLAENTGSKKFYTN